MTATGTEAVSIWAAGGGRWVLQDPPGGTSTHFLWCCRHPGSRGQAGRFMGSFALGWLWEAGLELILLLPQAPFWPGQQLQLLHTRICQHAPNLIPVVGLRCSFVVPGESCSGSAPRARLCWGTTRCLQLCEQRPTSEGSSRALSVPC